MKKNEMYFIWHSNGSFSRIFIRWATASTWLSSFFPAFRGPAAGAAVLLGRLLRRAIKELVSPLLLLAMFVEVVFLPRLKRLYAKKRFTEDVL